MKSLVILFSLAAVALSNAAVTITSRNFSSATVGVPILNANGTLANNAATFWSAGVLALPQNFSWTSTTATEVLSFFTPVAPTAFTGAAPRLSTTATLQGLFNAGQSGEFGNSTAPVTTFVGQRAYVLVGNNIDLDSSTEIAVFDSLSNFNAAGATGLGSQTLNVTTAAQVLFGTVLTPTQQPTLANAAFTQGVALSAVAIPETSTSLLGALGALALLRRRRN